MKARGYMSVFFSLSILSICTLLFAMVETARMAGARCYLQTAVNASIDSVFSQYHRELWEQYRLLFVEYQDEAQAVTDFARFLAPYYAADSWYPMLSEETVINQMLSATDSDGEYFEREILDYMKFGIWDLVFQSENLEQLFQSGIEAEAVHTIAGLFRGNTKSAWKLEQALELIAGCLEEQKQHLEAASASLNQYDGKAFVRSAKQLQHQLERIPSLVRAYEKEADQLLADLAENRQQLNLEQDKLSDAMRASLKQEFGEYESYITTDGERRLEIASLSGWSEEQVRIIEDAITEAAVVMEILADWDDDEEEPDEAALWGRVRQILYRCQKRNLSVSYGIQDKEKQNWLEQAELFFRLNILAAVLPEGTEVSKTVLDMEELPSQNMLASESTMEGSAGAQTNATGSLEALANRLMVTEYCGKFYTDFRASLNVEARPVSYEVEYLFAGDTSDVKNLENTVRRILLLREGWNLIHIISDSQKRQEARTLAAAIVGATGLVPLVWITAFFIMSVWALGESVVDLRLLLDGKKVPLLKSSGDWQLSLDNLLSIGQTGSLPEQQNSETGLTYESYLKFLLFFTDRITLYHRMMDIIQINLCTEQSSFRMKHARYRIDIMETVTNKHVFLSPFFFTANGSGTGMYYKSSAEAEKAY